MNSALSERPRVLSWRIVRDKAPAAEAPTIEVGAECRKRGLSAEAQMRVDESLAHRGEPVFRLFQWSRPACSLGYRQARPAWLSVAACAEAGVEVVERPTGGGLAVHGSDLSCSVTLPMDAGVSVRETVANTAHTLTQALATFGVHSQWIAEARAAASEAPTIEVGAECRKRGLSARVDYCLTQPSPYAIMIGSRKVCGFAIRRYPSSWLIQGSLLLRRIPEACRRLMPPAVARDFQTRAGSVEEAVSISDEAMIAAVESAWEQAWSPWGAVDAM